jgi:glycosyltransferase involved in cell wall biosynthesis
MTVYNGMPYLVEAVDSVRRQTLEAWELIIVDDGSTDDTAPWLDRLDDPRIRVVHQQNAGAPVASNRGLALCRAEFVARLDADDVALPTRLERQLTFLRAHPRVGVVGTQFRWLCEGRTGGARPIPCDHASIDRRLINETNGLVHSAMMCRAALLREIGGYWPWGVGEDYDIFLRMAERAELANLDEVLLHVRMVATSLQSRRMAEVRSLVGYACDAARRRRAQLPPVSYQVFCAERNAARWWTRLGRALEVHAMAQYRKAQPEILGSRRLVGYGRLALAAACAPHMTWQRIVGVVRHRWSALRGMRSRPSAIAGETEGGVAT